MATKNIIFIDIDGPLMPSRQWLTAHNSALLAECKGLMGVLRADFELRKQIKFDPVAVWMFNMWAKYSNSLGVVSSNWMNYTSVEEIKEIFKLNGLEIELHKDCVTPKKMSSYRCNEIQWWLDKHQRSVKDFIVVDDDWHMNPKNLATIGNDDYAFMGTRTVYINDDTGMTKDDFEYGLKLFKISNDTININEFKIDTKYLNR